MATDPAAMSLFIDRCFLAAMLDKDSRLRTKSEEQPMNPDIRSQKLSRHRLLARIHRSYVTTAQTVRVGEIILNFTRIADPDVVLDQVADQADRREQKSGRREPDEQLHLPYWAELWDSALAIGQFLAAGKDDAGTRGHRDAVKEEIRASLPASPRLRVPASSSALDLGCGMGLSGTIAAAVGHRVLFADMEPPALLFARLNSLPLADRIRARN